MFAIINDYFYRQINALSYVQILDSQMCAECHYARCQKNALRAERTHTRAIRGWIASTSRDSLPLFRFERVRNVQTTSVDDDDYGALSRDPFGIEIPENAPISLSYESHNGARLSKVDPSPRADIQKARGENTPRILRSLYSTSLMPTDKGRKGGPALTRRACIVRLCIIGRATRPDPRVIQRTIKNSALFDARVDGPRMTPTMRRRCVTRTRRRIPLGGREAERAIPIYEDRRRRGNPIPYDVRVEHVAINNLLRREGRSLCNALSLFVFYRLRLPFSHERPGLSLSRPSLPFLTLLGHPPPLGTQARSRTTLLGRRRCGTT